MVLPKRSCLGLYVTFLTLASGALAMSQATSTIAPRADETRLLGSEKPNKNDLAQELDADSLALSEIPADPLVRPDPLAFVFVPINRLVKQAHETERLKFGATYTFLGEYATTVPDSIKHEQVGGRLDFTGGLEGIRSRQ